MPEIQSTPYEELPAKFKGIARAIETIIQEVRDIKAEGGLSDDHFNNVADLIDLICKTQGSAPSILDLDCSNKAHILGLKQRIEQLAEGLEFEEENAEEDPTIVQNGGGKRRRKTKKAKKSRKIRKTRRHY